LLNLILLLDVYINLKIMAMSMRCRFDVFLELEQELPLVRLIRLFIDIPFNLRSVSMGMTDEIVQKLVLVIPKA
jgi:hypothetical protein